MSGVDFLTNTVTVRGKAYLVKEQSGKTMAEVRKLIAQGEGGRVEILMLQRCCLTPVFATEAEVELLPYYVIDQVSNEINRLTKLAGADAVEAAKNA